MPSKALAPLDTVARGYYWARIKPTNHEESAATKHIESS